MSDKSDQNSETQQRRIDAGASDGDSNTNDSARGFNSDGDSFPPEQPGLRDWKLASSYLIFLFAFLYLLDQLCWSSITPSSICGTYVVFGVVLFILIYDRLLHHEFLVHQSRRTDPSEVEAMFVEARTVEARLPGEDLPVNFETNKRRLMDEVKRLQSLDQNGWTEYQVLSLNQMLVDFLKFDDLEARARSSLVDLKDYALDSAYSFDTEQHDRWHRRIKRAIDSAEKKKKPKLRDANAEPLRAELRALLEDVAGYEQNWAEGKSIVRALITVGALAIPILLAMGLLPLIHPTENARSLGLLNWGLLGIIGSLAVVLRDLRKSDLVEIGNTRGRKELWRTILGGALGLLAGVLTYAMISGRLLATGYIVPDVASTKPEDAGLAILWAIGSGYSFERVFDRMRGVTEGRIE